MKKFIRVKTNNNVIQYEKLKKQYLFYKNKENKTKDEEDYVKAYAYVLNPIWTDEKGNVLTDEKGNVLTDEKGNVLTDEKGNVKPVIKKKRNYRKKKSDDNNSSN